MNVVLVIVGWVILVGALLSLGVSEVPTSRGAKLVIVIAGLLMMGVAVLLRRKQEVSVWEEAGDLHVESTTEPKLLKERAMTIRQEQDAKAAGIKEQILAQIKPLGFCQIAEDTVWIEEDDNIPIRAKVHEVIPVVREIADAENIDVTYQFCKYENDIPTINIVFFFLDNELTVGPEIPL